MPRHGRRRRNDFSDNPAFIAGSCSTYICATYLLADEALGMESSDVRLTGRPAEDFAGMVSEVVETQNREIKNLRSQIKKLKAKNRKLKTKKA